MTKKKPMLHIIIHEFKIGSSFETFQLAETLRCDAAKRKEHHHCLL